MWTCELCNKPVSNKGFRLFITYETEHYLTRTNRPTLKSECTTQIRLCGRCLKKTGKNLEIKI